MTGAADFYRLALDLQAAPTKVLGPLRTTFDQAGAQTIRQWRTAARVTSGQHGRRYPDALEYETRFTLGGNVEVEMGPDPSKPQGGMSFELGSRNQPPHLDGLKASQAMEPVLGRLADEAISKVIP